MRWMHLLSLLLIAGCALPAMPLEAVGEGYVRVALQMAQHDPDLVDDWRGDASWRPGPRVPVAELLSRIDELRSMLDRHGPAPPDRARHIYLWAQLRALHFAGRRLMGDAATIDDQARDEFGVRFSRIEAPRIAELHAAIGDALPGKSPLADRVAALKARTVVSTERRGPVMNAALSACRQATAVAWPLPADERVTVAFRNGLGWDGYARYAGNRHTDIAINSDGPLDVSRAVRLACHEGYPGHHVQHLLIDELSWPELKLSPGFGPHLLYTEGAAEAGAILAFSIAERVTLFRGQLLPLAGIPDDLAGTLVRVDSLLNELLPVVTEVARQYLAGTIDRDTAIQRLRTEALLSNPEGALSLIERRRARALVYGEGRRIISAQLEQWSPYRDSNRYPPSLAALHALFTRTFAVQ
jgi:hypothetical protein